MRVLSFVALSFFFIASVAFSQNQEKSIDGGSTALIFQLGGFGEFGLTGDFAGSTSLVPLTVPGDSLFQDLLGGLQFPVAGIGVKTFLGDNVALRGAVGLNYSSETRQVSSTDTAGNMVTEEETDHMFVGAFAPGFEYHFGMAGPVSGYIGAMLSFTGGIKSTGAEGNKQTDKSSSFFIGPILGAEFFPWDNVSFGAEYFFAFSSTSTSREVGDTESDGPSYVNIGTSNFAVKASLYFN